MRIQHNIAAMSSYRNYTNNVAAVNKNLEKLSSGYKINRAGDDAAGLAISEKMRAQISGLEAAQKNAKDGISLVQTAEGALTEVHDMLNRMVTLATQSANGTYDNDTDRFQLQKEMDQLKSEINRIADSSNFNGIQLLDGSMATKSAITGVKDATLAEIWDGQLAGKEAQPGVFTVDLSGAKLTNSDSTKTLSAKFTVGNKEFSVTVDKGATLQGNDLAKAIKTAIDAKGTFQDADKEQYDVSVENGTLVFTQKNIPAKGLNEMSAFEFKYSGTLNGAHPATGAVQFSNQGGELNVTVRTEPVSNANERIYAKATMKLDATNVYDGSAIKIGDTTYVFAIGPDSQYKNYANAVDMTDITATDTNRFRVAAGRLTTAAAENKSFIVGSDVNSATITFTEKEGAVDYSKNNLAGSDGVSDGSEVSHKATATTKGVATQADWAGLIQIGKVNTDKSTNGLVLQIGDTAASYNQLRVSINDCHTTAMGLDGVSIATQEGAAAAVDKIKSAINYVSDVRGTLGATQNRLEHTINNLSVMTENIQDAESTIRDTDIAEEMMAYTKNNILVQSAQAMLAQANQIPQGVLQLLG